MNRVFTVQEAAEALRTHPNMIRRLLQQGRLGGFRLGRAWRITDADLDLYAARQGRLSPVEREWVDLMQAQESALNAVWDNVDDEVWNGA
ncbi:MAG: helix-turn-helix domain-containing protein [Candidatus Competibacter sp.]|nr:helix-turn-helix domain-containing protein [Candidatus Competibacter sp.]